MVMMRRVRSVGWGALVVVSALLMGRVEATSPRVEALSARDAFARNLFMIGGGAPAVSPDGSRSAYVVCDSQRRSEVSPEHRSRIVANPGSAMYSLGCDVWVGHTSPEGESAKNISAAEGNNWGPSWSPDGRALAFISDRDGAPKLYLWNSTTNQVRKLSDEILRTVAGEERPQWLPNGRAILVRLRPRNMSDQALGILGAQLETRPPEWKSAKPTVVVYESGVDVASQGRRALETRRAEVGQRAPGLMISDIGLIFAEDGSARRLVDASPIPFVALAPNGRSFVYLEWQEDMPSGMGTYRLVNVQLDSGKREELASNINTYGYKTFSWSPDSRYIAYFSTTGDDQLEKGDVRAGHRSDSRGDLFFVPASGGAVRRCAAQPRIVGFNSNATRPLWDPASNFVYAVADNGIWRGEIGTGQCRPLAHDPNLAVRFVIELADRDVAWTPGDSVAVISGRDVKTKKDGFYSINAKGQIRPEITEPKRHSNVLASANGVTLVYQAQSAVTPEDLWLTNAAFETPHRLTRINPHLDRYTFGTSRVVEFRNADGKNLQAALLLPADHEPGRRYPLIVVVYASERGSENVHNFGLWPHGQYNYQMLATRGYAVLYPDVPVQKGMPLQEIGKSVLPAIEEVVRLGFADGDRVGVMGQSNGGYSALSLIIQSDRFKAAVMNAGVSDLAGLYGVMDLRTGGGTYHPWLLRLGGAMGYAPWENPLGYVQNSPFYYLDRITTPLLIQAGGQDYGLVNQSDQVYVGLAQLGKDVTYLRYEGEAHLLEIPSNIDDYWSRTLKFWHRHLGGAQ